MLGFEVFSCTCTHAIKFDSTRPSLAHAHMCDVSLADPLLHLHTCGMLSFEAVLALARMQGFGTTRSSLALAHMRDVILADLLLHLRTCVILCFEDL